MPAKYTITCVKLPFYPTKVSRELSADYAVLGVCCDRDGDHSLVVRELVDSPKNACSFKIVGTDNPFELPTPSDSPATPALVCLGFYTTNYGLLTVIGQQQGTR